MFRKAATSKSKNKERNYQVISMSSQSIDKENNKRDKMDKIKSTKNAAKHVKEYIPNANRRAAGSNWQLANGNANSNNNNIKELISNNVNGNDNVVKSAPSAKCDADNTKEIAENSNIDGENKEQQQQQQQQKKVRRKRNKWGNKHIAMDCEMVGIGLNGEDDMLARVSIVNRHGNVLMDKYVKPTAEVIDYRTSVSGIRPADIENGENFDSVQHAVIDMLQGRILVGHGLRKDLSVLKITHPFCNIRDTSSYKPLARLVANGRTPSLKRLVHCLFGQQIQTGEHDSVEDARAAMNIYNSCCQDWEKYLQRKMR